MQKKYSITGMTCAACSSGIERTVKKLKGVESCAVSLMGESMDVTFDEGVITDAGIKKAVTSLGYGAYNYGEVPQKRKKRLTLGLRFVLSLILLLPEMYFAMGHMISENIVPHGWANYGVQIALTLAVLAINYAFFVSGVRAAVRLVPNMDTLVTLGAAVSFVYSLVMACISPEQPTLFFESAAMIVTLVTLGKWLEDKSKRRTGREIEKLLSLAPDTVTVERGGQPLVIPLSEVTAGDVVIVKQGESVAVDGTVLEGHAFCDQSAVTGESLPVELSPGSHAMSASLVTGGYLKIRAEKVGEETMLSSIIRMVREAGASKAPIQKLADKISAVFVPVVLGIALVTFLAWLLATGDVQAAFNFGVNVIVISWRRSACSSRTPRHCSGRRTSAPFCSTRPPPSPRVSPPSSFSRRTGRRRGQDPPHSPSRASSITRSRSASLPSASRARRHGMSNTSSAGARAAAWTAGNTFWGTRG